jgi:hypothetical protein
MQGRKVTTKDIRRADLPSRNILNTTLVTQVEIIEDGVLKFYNWDVRTKVYAMLEDTGKRLRIIINHQTKTDARHIDVQGGELLIKTELS